MSALEVQVGGEHYKSAKIQPVQYIEANDIKFLEGCVIKRCTRHDKPTGKGREDIEKAIHELQLLLELRYGSKGLIETTSVDTTGHSFDIPEELRPPRTPVAHLGGIPPAAPAPSTCYKVGCPNYAVRYGACAQHQQKEDEATHRDGGGSKFKQNDDGRWMQWGFESWFTFSSDPKDVPKGLLPISIK